MPKFTKEEWKEYIVGVANIALAVYGLSLTEEQEAVLLAEGYELPVPDGLYNIRIAQDGEIWSAILSNSTSSPFDKDKIKVASDGSITCNAVVIDKKLYRFLDNI